MFRSPRMLTIWLLGFSSGLPLVLTGSTLQAWFTEAGVGIMTIGLLSLVGMPYVWKFLWAPVLDRFVPPWGGRRRGWVALTQLALCVALFILANLSPQNNAGLMGLMALVIAFFSASQDVAIDAYRTEVLSPSERGLGAANYIFAYRIAMLFAGGLALVFADYIGWRMTYEWMAVLMGLSVITTYKAKEPSQFIIAPKTFTAAVVEPFRNLWRRENIILILLFIVLYKIGDALALSLMSNFLLKNLGFTLSTVGITYKTFGLVATIFGAFCGGLLLSNLNIYRALFLFGLAQAISNLMFVILAMVGKNYLLMASSIGIESFCSGMSTAALVAFLMSLCELRYTATQFALLSALSSIGRVILGPVAAIMVKKMGWVDYFTWAFLMSFPGLFLIGFLRKQVLSNETVVTESD